MGLFSSKKKTRVGTSVSRLIEDDQLPETIKTAILTSLMHEEDMVERILEDVIYGPALRIERLFRYAKKKYAYGLPSSSLVTEKTGEDVVRAVLERELGGSVTLEYLRVGPINSGHLAWQTLHEQYDYDPETNEIGTLSREKGVPVYLKGFYPVIPTDVYEEADEGLLDPWGDPSNAGYTPERPGQIGGKIGMYRKPPLAVIDPTAEHESIVFEYVYELESEEEGEDPAQEQLLTGEFRVSMASFDTDTDFYQAKYRLKKILVEANPEKNIEEKSVTTTGYWTYEDGTELFPEVDKINDMELSDLGTYFPFIFFRHNRENRAAEKFRGTPEYKTTQKLLDYLHMDFQTMSDNIHANEDIGDVEQAVLMFAVPAETENEAERQYLFDYFNALHLVQPTAYGGSTGGLFGRLIDEAMGKMFGSAIVIQDADFKISLSYKKIEKKRVAGVIGKVGSHDSGVGSQSREELVRVDTPDSGYRTVTRNVETKYIYYRRQINSLFYEEIRVFTPKLQYSIWRKYSTIADIGNGNLLIPLDHAITDKYKLSVKEELYPRSLHFVFNSRVTTKVKWYQSGIFKAVLTIAAVVLLILYPPAGYGLLVAAVGAGLYVAAMWIVLTMVVKALLVNYAFKLFVKEVGAEFAFIAAIVATIAGIGGGIKGAPWAQSALATATGLTSGIQTETARLISEYRDDVEEFNLFMEEANKELEEAKNLLKTTSLIDPFEFIGREPIVIWGETPDDFYQRTVHSGNIGIVGVDAIHHYVDIALQLPDMTRADDTQVA